MKCPRCGEERQSTGDIPLSRKVWSPSVGSLGNSPAVRISEPVTNGFSPVRVRAACLNPMCERGVIPVWYRDAYDRSLRVYEYKPCPCCRHDGFLVVSLGQGLPMPKVRDTVPWRYLADNPPRVGGDGA